MYHIFVFYPLVEMLRKKDLTLIPLFKFKIIRYYLVSVTYVKLVRGIATNI